MRATEVPHPTSTLDTTVPASRSGVLLIAGAAVLWGTSGLTATAAYSRGLDPLGVSFSRMAIGAIALLVLQRGAGIEVRTLWSHRRRLMVVGAGLGGYQAGYFLAVDHAGVSVATLITLGLAPVLVTALDRLRSGQAVRPRTLIAMLLAIGGLLALVAPTSAQGDGVLIGAGFAALSALGYAFVTLGGGSLSETLGAQQLTVASFAIAAILLAPAAALGSAGTAEWTPSLVGALLYLGVVPTALAYSAFFAGLRHVPAPVAAILALLEPLVATALAIPLLGERLTAAGWGGAIALMTAVILVSRASTVTADS